MEKFRLFKNLMIQSWKAICQQLWLLAALSMLFLLLILGVGPVARGSLSQGVDFSGLIIGVCAPEGDSTARLLAELTDRMEDIRQYCAFVPLEEGEGEEALEAGEITALLILPDRFIQGVLNGENPDLQLLVAGDRPLESLLTWWVGQSAADLLTAAQRGIYAVLEAWEPGLDISYDQVKLDINMRYISRTLDRQSMFRTQQLRAVETMELETHYGLSLLIFLTMTLAPLLRPGFLGDRPMRRRLRALGHGTAVQFPAVLTAAFGVIFLITLIPAGVISRWNLPGMTVTVLFAVCFGSFCALAGRTAAGCGWLGVILGGAFTFLAGGIMPTALLPRLLQRLGLRSPVTFLRSLLHGTPDRWKGEAVLGILAWSALFALGAALLYRESLKKEGEA